MAVIEIKRLGEFVGAEVLDVDVTRLLTDPDLPAAYLEALAEHGVLVLRGLHLDDATQVRFCRRLGPLVTVPGKPIPEITVISLEPDNPLADYFKGAFEWHIDGTTDDVPSKAAILTAHKVTSDGGETEFASTCAAFEALNHEEKDRLSALRVVHSFAASQLKVNPDPTAEQLADWNRRPRREHPLVWRHRSGRRSLVLGSTAEAVTGLDGPTGRALLDDLLRRATTPERVFRHSWSVGDTLMWDNRGVIHRGRPYPTGSERELHRSTLVGDEPIG